MSFFKDLKDDMSEAMNGLSEENTEELADAVSEEDLSAADEEIVEEIAAEDFSGLEDIVDGALVDESLMEDYLGGDGTDDEGADDFAGDDYEEAAETAEDDDSVERTADVSQVTIITKGTTINGSIISDCSLDVMGTISGDIECLGKLSISGNVVGNSVASEVFVNARRLEGNIDSEGAVKIGLGTVVIGDIKAGSGVIAGAVKGELDIQGPVVIDSTAIIKGNIKAKSVQMNNGAVVEGFCSLSYSSVNVDDIFE